MKHLALIPALSAIISFPALRAAEPEAGAVRSIVTAPAGLTDVGVLELELGGSQSYGKDHTREGGIAAQFNLGLSSWLDLRLGWTARAWNRDADGQGNDGVSDPYIGGQVLFAGQDKTGADIGLAYSHLMPRASVSKGLSSGYHEDTLLFTISRSMGRWALDANAGVARTRVEDGSRKANQKVGSVAITYAPAQGWNLTLDTYGVAKSDLGDRELGSILAASCDINDKLTVDMSVERGWADASPRFAFNAGLIYRIGKLWGN
ncbi:transporter [Holophaga foetida]|uniref:transporter n=1 Tax=Holophaga foetida TaxID=35839 RepID=UPI00024717E3|nr:transporter [Holophaga foetida]